jgi:hypothetical protein
VDRLETVREEASRSAIEKASKAATDALRAGSPALPETGHAASLASALAYRAALEAAHAELATEHAMAQAEVLNAANEVAVKVNAVMDFTARRLISELLAARDLFWRLEAPSRTEICRRTHPGGRRLSDPLDNSFRERPGMESRLDPESLPKPSLIRGLSRRGILDLSDPWTMSAVGSLPNPSLAHLEPISCAPKRKLENGGQRQPLQIRWLAS